VFFLIFIFLPFNTSTSLPSKTQFEIMQDLLELNKAVVRRFNYEVLQDGNLDSFAEIMHPEFINRTAPPTADNGAQGMINTVKNVLHQAFPGLKVDILEQIAEGDLVSSRKTITGKHTGNLLGIPPTGLDIKIDVMDMVRLKDGQYLEHWGLNTIPLIIAQLKDAAERMAAEK